MQIHINKALLNFTLTSILFGGISGCGLFRQVSQPEIILVDSVNTVTSLDTTLGPVRPVVIPPNNITFILNPKLLPVKPTDTTRKGNMTAGYVYNDKNGQLKIFCNMDSMILLNDSLRTMLVTKTTETKQYQTRVIENIALQDSLKKDRQKLLYWLIGIIVLDVLVFGIWVVLKIKTAPASAATKITAVVKKGLDP